MSEDQAVYAIEGDEAAATQTKKKATKNQKKLEKRRELLQDSYERASQTYQLLSTEYQGIEERLREAAKKDRRNLEEAALAGGFEGDERMPRLEQVRKRAQDLPFLVFGAEVLMRRLAVELGEVRQEELQAEAERIYADLQKAEEELSHVSQRRDALQLQWHNLVEQRHAAQQLIDQNRNRLAHLQDSGPNL